MRTEEDEAVIRERPCLEPLRGAHCACPQDLWGERVEPQRFRPIGSRRHVRDGDVVGQDEHGLVCVVVRREGVVAAVDDARARCTVRAEHACGRPCRRRSWGRGQA